MSWLDVPATEIVREVLDATRAYMVEHFGISSEEAEGRLNSWFGYRPLTSPDTEAAIEHELPRYWAHTIYYGPDSEWWKVDPSTLTPLLWP